MVALQPTVITAGPFNSATTHSEWTESPPRVLSTFEIAMFVRDGGTAWLNGHECPIREGYILFSKPGDVRWNKLHFQCQTVHFFADDPVLLQMLDTLPQFFKPEDTEKVFGLFKAVESAFSSPESFSSVGASGRMCELLWYLHIHNATDNASFGQTAVRKAVQMIQGRYDEALSVEQMAKACGLSTSHFHKVFVESTGTTPNRYLILTRLTAAKNMLAAGKQSVVQVAASCGFSSQAYFSQCMKKFTGMSPKSFMRSAKTLEDI